MSAYSRRKCSLFKNLRIMYLTFFTLYLRTVNIFYFIFKNGKFKYSRMSYLLADLSKDRFCIVVYHLRFCLAIRERILTKKQHKKKKKKDSSSVVLSRNTC